ncbi:MAG TPA: hypothetical protein VGD06_05250 [Acidobacteriota bacterium]
MKRRMRGAALLVALIGALVAFVGLVASAQERVGDVRPGKVPIPRRIGDTLWVSSDELVGRMGGPDAWRVPDIGAAFQGMLEAQRHRPSGNCLELSGASYEHSRTPETFEDFVVAARVIVRGKVTGAAGGFYRATAAGLLIQVEVTEWIKRADDFPQTSFIHFFYPVGDFSVGDVHICARQRGWPVPPALGDDVLLFPRGHYPPSQLVHIAMDGNELVTGNDLAVRYASPLSGFEEFRKALNIDDVVAQMAVVLLAVGEGDGTAIGAKAIRN